MKMLQQHMLEQHSRHLCNICIKVSNVLARALYLQSLPFSRECNANSASRSSIGNVDLHNFCKHELNGSSQT